MIERAHQRKMNDLASEITVGVSGQRSITLDCTPGGGKTGAATLLANRLLDAGLVEKVLWIVPRLSLAEQVCQGFTTGFASRQGRQLEIVSGQGITHHPTLPNMPLNVGWVTTYQSIASGNNYTRFRDILLAHRTLIIFDEIQFLSEEADRGWYAKVKKIDEAATFHLLMSGTLWRTDNHRIPLVEYRTGEDGKLYPVFDIQYGYREAVGERAILHSEWHTRSGKVEYIYGGVTQIHELLEDAGEEESRKLRAFLADEPAVNGLIDNMTEHWQDWKRRQNYQSRQLVIAQDIREARRIFAYVEKRHSIPCVLATSKDDQQARAIRKFRERSRGQCLVTVAMAYVGFDCPDLSHLAYLGLARAPSWMLQSFARVSRFDRNSPVDYEHQHAFIFSPDDERSRRFFDWLRAETLMGVRNCRGGNGQRAKPEVLMPDDFEPVSATPAGTAIESLLGRLDPATEARLRAFITRCPAAANLPHSQLFQVLLAAGVDLSRPSHSEGAA